MNLCDCLKHNCIRLTTFPEFSRKIITIQKSYISSVTRNAYKILPILFILIISLCRLSVKHFSWHTVETGMKKNSENPVPSCLQQVLDAFFFPHTDIILTLFTWYQVEIKFWTKVTIKTYVSEYTTAGIQAKCHFLSLSLVCHDLFARLIFIWKIRWVCLLDQDASLCHLCCHHNSFDITSLWNHLENWRWWRNSLLSKTHCCKFIYIYTFGISAAVSERSFMYCWDLGPTCLKEVFLIKYIQFIYSQFKYIQFFNITLHGYTHLY